MYIKDTVSKNKMVIIAYWLYICFRCDATLLPIANIFIKNVLEIGPHIYESIPLTGPIPAGTHIIITINKKFSLLYGLNESHGCFSLDSLF